jgi:hypothetical protein
MEKQSLFTPKKLLILAAINILFANIYVYRSEGLEGLLVVPMLIPALICILIALYQLIRKKTNTTVSVIAVIILIYPVLALILALLAPSYAIQAWMNRSGENSGPGDPCVSTRNTFVSPSCN